jgi:hypothetical protein
MAATAAYLEPIKHMVRENDRLQLDAHGVAVFAREHVDLPLIDAELANVGLQEEDICGVM